MPDPDNPAVLGTDAFTTHDDEEGSAAPTWGEVKPGGIDADELSADREVTEVRIGLVAPAATFPNRLKFGGTYAAMFKKLEKLKTEWGRGGTAGVRNEAQPRIEGDEVIAILKSNLVLEMPTWTGYTGAPEKDQGKWDAMVKKLKLHEDRHVEIAIEEASTLEWSLIAVKFSKVPGIVTKCNAAILSAQQDMDKKTNHGAKPGVNYGDVNLAHPDD